MLASKRLRERNPVASQPRIAEGAVIVWTVIHVDGRRRVEDVLDADLNFQSPGGDIERASAARRGRAESVARKQVVINLAGDMIAALGEDGRGARGRGEPQLPIR